MLNEGCRRVQKGRTNRKREEWQVNAKSGHESDQREEQYIGAQKHKHYLRSFFVRQINCLPDQHHPNGTFLGEGCIQQFL